MTNKKLKKINEKSVILVVFILLAVLAIGSLVVMKPKTTFTIYEEVCENETIRTVTKRTKVEPIYIDCNKTITVDGVFKRCWNEIEDSDWSCAEEYCFFQYDNYFGEYYLTTTYIQVQLEDYTEDISKDIFETFNQTEEVCNQVEVDKMEIKVGFDEIGNFVRTSFEVKNKEDLTIEFLELNCECIECYVEGITENHLVNSSYCNDDFKGDEKCKKYSCRNYTIEVEQ